MVLQNTAMTIRPPAGGPLEMAFNTDVEIGAKVFRFTAPADFGIASLNYFRGYADGESQQMEFLSGLTIGDLTPATGGSPALTLAGESRIGNGGLRLAGGAFTCSGTLYLGGDMSLEGMTANLGGMIIATAPLNLDGADAEALTTSGLIIYGPATVEHLDAGGTNTVLAYHHGGPSVECVGFPLLPDPSLDTTDGGGNVNVSFVQLHRALEKGARVRPERIDEGRARLRLKRE